ncbi:uncharacterized protein PGTG_20647 [Puccinia graminis f. sp. tritici CRL 75-36-700-3]|uniref:BRCA2 OB1 domain-containing protein n=1 Tax=Puccinia graminis f. sp. tritici (strain CRL 75-36-700-3 / race SCCL) TaxID=418459 RepID=H6QNT9_PUCGT|nr:uncharacterized protein PGTG_20647 [Puccinia graminis f. sp. tritici CRL 75-36-700-3]EHS62527.1 hypothetical protein PGTG_20647 [Puccinia graminis f. sp. tritici CRL 75-36-700-3]
MSAATSNTNDGRPTKRTRFSTSEQPEDGSRPRAGPVEHAEREWPEAEVSGSSQNPRSSEGNVLLQDHVESDPRPVDRQAPPLSTVIHHPLASVASQSQPDREQSLTPLTETRSEDRPLTAEVSENDLEISQYDIWSDCEQEELDALDETELLNSKILNTSQLATPATIQDQAKPSQAAPDLSNELVQGISQSESNASPDHQPSSAQQSINPSRSNSSPLHRQSNLDSSQSPVRIKRSVSSLFTTGTGEPFPMAIEQPITSPPFESTIFPPRRPSAPPNPPSITSQADDRTAQITCEVPESGPSKSKPRRALSSLFQTGAGQPFPMYDPTHEGSSSSAQNQDCPVFGFQTARGNTVAAPSKESMRKALDICNNDNLSPFPKPHYKEPDSPSPSHRAKMQKVNSQSVSPSKMSNNQTDDNQSQADMIPARTPQAKEFSPTGSSVMYPPITKFDSSKPSVGLFSTGAGAPIHIPISAVERARAHLDNPSQSSELHPLPTNESSSPLKDVSNLRPASQSNHRMTHDLLTGSINRQSNHHSISAKLHESLNAVVPKIPSQPTTAASLMSTPIRTLSNGISRPNLQNSPHEPISLPSVPHTTTAPVRRISNRMHIGLTPQSSSRRVSHESKGPEPRSFITPFKKKIEVPHAKPGQFNSLCTPARDSSNLYQCEETPSLDPSRRSVMYIDPPTPFSRQGSSGKPQSVFDLSTRSTRRKIPMVDWLASPKGYSARHLLSLAVPESVVFMTAKSAAIWSFNAFTEPFGAIHALGELLQAGCSINRCSPKWVANHWALIIWKLAAMVRWQPDCLSRVWNPSNAVQQLKYRYEREFVCGDRSALKRILDNDCPSSMPMCLVIVGIIRRPGPSSATKGIPVTTEILELSDGWYKIKAHLDPVLARVLKRGTLRVGFKLAISGASTEAPAGPSSKSSGEKKSTILKETDDGKEEEVRLYLEGNATSRARWPETLGFRPRPWVASLRSLSPDGGRIPLMDIVISKVFPPMFVDQEGRMGRWGVAEENMLQVAWEKEREKEAAKIAGEQEQEFEKIQQVADLVASIYAAKSDGKRRVSGDKRNGEEADSEEFAAFDADELCDDLIEDDASMEVMKQLSVTNLVQLRQSVQRRCDTFRSKAVDELQKTLNSRVPLRRTRQVQQLTFRDFQTFKTSARTPSGSPSRLVGQLSVQDLSLLPDRFFKEGARYWVHNIQPQRNARWDLSASSSSKNFKNELVEVPLSTRRDTTWRNISLDA